MVIRYLNKLNKIGEKDLNKLAKKINELDKSGNLKKLKRLGKKKLKNIMKHQKRQNQKQKYVLTAYLKLNIKQQDVQIVLLS